MFTYIKGKHNEHNLIQQNNTVSFFCMNCAAETNVNAAPECQCTCVACASWEERAVVSWADMHHWSVVCAGKHSKCVDGRCGCSSWPVSLPLTERNVTQGPLLLVWYPPKSFILRRFSCFSFKLDVTENVMFKVKWMIVCFLFRFPAIL